MVILILGIIGWVYCGALVAVGRKFLPMQTTLILHAAGAPVGFALLSAVYFLKFGSSSPRSVAAGFLATVITLDALLVAPVFERSFAMFASVLGTWFPFGLIFASTYLTGKFVERRRGAGSLGP